MRKRRSTFTGDTHPTRQNPSFLDMCGWCHNWIANREERGYAHIVLDRPYETPVAYQSIDDHSLVALVPGPEGGMSNVDGVVLLCSEECDVALRVALLKDAARQRREAVPKRVVSDDERHEAAAVLKDYCAWCRAALEEDAPVQTVSAPLTGELATDDTMIALEVGGRDVHAVIPPPEVPLPEGHQILFLLCSHRCAKALAAAVDADLRSRARSLRRSPDGRTPADRR